MSAIPIPPPAAWRMPRPYGLRTLLIAVLALLCLGYTGQRVEVGRMLELSGEGVLAAAGLRDGSQVSSGLAKVTSSLWPLQISEKTEIGRIENFDPQKLPWLARIESLPVVEQKLDPDTLTMKETVTSQTFMVEPIGYAAHVAHKMFETLEMALWGTLLAVVLSVPLAVLGARNYTPHRVVYIGSRALVSFLRAIPELISALFLVLAYGFGPIAGVLALTLHSTGFLGKFYAEDIENADDRPQEALRAIGTSRLKVLRYAVLPQVFNQYIAYTLYVLDRNVRMAAVVGLVGAGGIGQELKGRYDMYNYSHVATILLAIFITVFVLDQLAAQLRRRFA